MKSDGRAGVQFCSLATHKFGSENRLSPHTCSSDTDRCTQSHTSHKLHMVHEIDAEFNLVNDHSVLYVLQCTHRFFFYIDARLLIIFLKTRILSFHSYLLSKMLANF